MIISHNKQFAFFRVPKTGSTTAEFVLRLSQAFDPVADWMSAIQGLPSTLPQALYDPIEAHVIELFPAMPEDKRQGSVDLFIAHMTPADAMTFGLITFEQLRAYRCFAYLRDPYERAISAHKHSVGTRFMVTSIFEKTMNSLDELRSSHNLLWKPQVDYFYVNGERVTERLEFSDYANELNRVISIMGGREFEEVPRLNKSKEIIGDTSVFQSDAVKRRVAEVYSDDWELFSG